LGYQGKRDRGTKEGLTGDAKSTDSAEEIVYSELPFLSLSPLHLKKKKRDY
jgi:hypothetical protein